MTGTPEQEAKLPKWAQNELYRLRTNETYWKAQALAGPEQSNTFVVQDGESIKPLGDSPNIRFNLGPDWHEKIEVRVEGNRVLVYGGDTLAVMPRSSNYCEIRLTHD